MNKDVPMKIATANQMILEGTGVNPDGKKWSDWSTGNKRQNLEWVPLKVKLKGTYNIYKVSLKWKQS